MSPRRGSRASSVHDRDSSNEEGLNDLSKVNSIPEEATEQSHLLSHHPESGQVTDLLREKRQWLSRQNLLVLCFFLVAIGNCGDQILESPMSRVSEAVICYRYYEVADPAKIQVGREAVGPGAVGGVDEMWCKADAVQSQLALLRGYGQLFDGIPSLLLAMPFGWAADKFGRRPFLMLGLISNLVKVMWIELVLWFWQAFDIRMTWLSSLTGLVSGGSPVLSAVFFVILSDLTYESERAAVFLRVGASGILAALLMPPLGAWLMTFNPWIANGGGTLLLVVTCIVASLVPETQNMIDHSKSHPSTPPPEAVPAPPDPSGARPLISLDFAGRWTTKLTDAGDFLTTDWRVPALIVPFVGQLLIAAAAQLLLQYCSKRYHITFSDATLLLTIFNAVKFLALFILLPYLSQFAMRVFHLSGQKKDLYFARGSLICGVVGWTFIGLSPDIPTVAIALSIAALGSGTSLLIRSFLTSLVPAHHVARVYSIVSMVDTIGAMFGGTLLAGLFKQGMALGGGWIGLPFYFFGVMLASFTVLLFIVRLRKGEGERLSENGS